MWTIPIRFTAPALAMALAGCSGTERTTNNDGPPAATVELAAATATGDSTASQTSVAAVATPAPTSTVPFWIPEEPTYYEDSKPPPKNPCKGEFCVREADAKGAPAASSPYAQCATNMPHPEGRAKQQNVGFAYESTRQQRLKKKDACCYYWSVDCKSDPRSK